MSFFRWGVISPFGENRWSRSTRLTSPVTRQAWPVYIHRREEEENLPEGDLGRNTAQLRKATATSRTLAGTQKNWASVLLSF